MPGGQPYAWNVLVVGAWNVAILTPDGIRKRLFELSDGTPVEVEVSIDRPGLLRVIHDGVVVSPSSRALEVAPEKLERASLLKATEIARRALHALPETPASAAGVNIRYKFSALPDELIDLVRAPIDDVLSDADYVIEEGLTKRSLALSPGVVNVEITHGHAGEGTVTLNFHRESSSHSELENWLSKTDEFLGAAEKLLGLLKSSVQQQEETP